MKKIIQSKRVPIMGPFLGTIFFTLIYTATCHVAPQQTMVSRAHAQDTEQPSLIIGENITAYSGNTVTVPISFIGAEYQIAAVDFALEYDEECLSIDGAESMVFNIPRGSISSVVTDENPDIDIQLGAVIADYSPPFTTLIDDEIVFIEFLVTCAVQPGESTRVIPVSFAPEPKPSFGDVEFNDVPGQGVGGSILLQAGTSNSTPLPSATNTPSPTATSINITITPPSASPTTSSITPSGTEIATSTPTLAIGTITPIPSPSAIATTPATIATLAPTITMTFTSTPSPDSASTPVPPTNTPHNTPHPTMTVVQQTPPTRLPGTSTTTNSSPVAVDDQVVIGEGGLVIIDVLSNDFDFDGDSLRVIDFEQGTYGLVELMEDGRLLYKLNSQLDSAPSLLPTDIDIFHYTILDRSANDTMGESATATVIISLDSINYLPNLQDDRATTDEDVPMIIDVLANDRDRNNDTLTVTEVSQGASGRVGIQPDGRILYTPDRDYYGEDIFVYQVVDPQGNLDNALVRITVTSINDAPVASPDRLTVPQNQPTDIVVLTNDSDIDGDVLTVSSVTRALHGGVLLNPDHVLTYVPNPNYIGNDSFQYTVSDGYTSVSTNVWVTVTEEESQSLQTPTMLPAEEESFVQIFLPLIQR